jgi:hypothetical protein
MFRKNIIKNPTCFGHYYMTILRGRPLYLVHYHFSACLQIMRILTQITLHFIHCSFVTYNTHKLVRMNTIYL